MRGFGASTPMPRDFPWTLDRHHRRFCRLIDHLGIDRFHLVGAKIGGTIARAFAARRPERVNTLTVVGTPPPLRAGAAESVPELNADFERTGSRPGRARPWEPARQRVSARRVRVVDPVHGPHRGLDPDRLYANHRLRRHPRRSAEDPLPDPGHHHRR